MSFKNLGLSEPILKSLSHKGYKEPTPIQQESIPAILEGKDVMAAAQTGTGKTASFTLPILHMLSHPKNDHKGHQVRALIITPTRELAAQVRDNVLTYGNNLNLRSTAVYGGARIHNQQLKLKKGVDILVATPGRLLDLYNQKSVNFSKVEILVLDEADQMLDMGFIHDIKKIINLLPQQRQNLMFTATFSNPFRKLANELVENPIEISVTSDNETAANVDHYVHPVDKSRKAELLIELIETEQWKQALVFTRTKHGADRLTKQLLKVDIKAAAIHGNKTQNTEGLIGTGTGNFISGSGHIISGKVRDRTLSTCQVGLKIRTRNFGCERILKIIPAILLMILITGKGPIVGQTDKNLSVVFLPIRNMAKGFFTTRQVRFGSKIGNTENCSINVAAILVKGIIYGFA